MNKAEDKLFENDFYRVLDSKVKTRKAAKSGFMFDLSHDVPSKEIKNPNKTLPKGRYRVIEDKGYIIKIEEVEVGGRGGKEYSISKQLLDSLIQISKEGSTNIKAVEIGYRYGLRDKPYTINTAPLKPIKVLDPEEPGAFHNVLIYGRVLAPQEIEKYNLVDLNEQTKEYQILSKEMGDCLNYLVKHKNVDDVSLRSVFEEK
jgi:hypothetical protein